MSILNVATTEIVSIDKNKTLEEASKSMREHHVGCLVVTDCNDGNERPCGILTDRDIALHLINTSTVNQSKVLNVMESEPIVVRDSDDVFEVSAKMKRFGVRRVPVVGASGEWKGIVSIDDLLQLLSEELRNLAEIYESQSRNEASLLRTLERPKLESIGDKVLTSINRANSKF